MNNILKIGRGTINKIEDSLSHLQRKNKILYVSDRNVDMLYGTIVKNQLSTFGIIKEEFVKNNTISYSMSIAERVIATDIDFIVALGGGKVLDVCKYAAYISKAPILSIPTTAANDGVASPIAVLKRKDNLPKSLGCAMPNMVIIDIDIICKCPVELIKAGIGDTISNYMALKDWKFACDRNKDEMNGYAYLMSENAIDVLMKSQFQSINTEFIEVLVNSLVLSGIAMDFSGNSRPVSGSEHLFSHALDFYCERKNLHGIQVALGTIAMLKILDLEYGEVLKYLTKFGVDINPFHLGIDKDTFVYCFQHAKEMRKERYTYLNELDLETIYLEKVYNELVEEL